MESKSLERYGSGSCDCTNAKVRLREARLGRMFAETRTNGLGDFTFEAVERGLYVAELVTDAGRAIAAGQVFSIEAGQTVAVGLTVDSIPALMVAGETAAGLAGASPTIATAAGIASTVLSAVTTAGTMLVAPVGPPVSGEK